MRHPPRGLAPLLQTLFVVSLVWTSCFLAWGTLRAVDFGYPLLYDLLAIDDHIARYGPRNRFKHGFETTDRAQRLALFGAINDAVHAGGRGLEQLRYTDADGRAQQLLRLPEVVHLRSVARLIGRLEAASWPLLALLGVAVAVMRRLRVPPPRPRRVGLWTAAVVIAGAVVTLGYGAEKTFYLLHSWVFPPGEQWYFFYEESLMTTLMKAPDLFGAIALLLLLAAAFYFALLLTAAVAVLRPGFTPARG